MGRKKTELTKKTKEVILYLLENKNLKQFDAVKELNEMGLKTPSGKVWTQPLLSSSYTDIKNAVVTLETVELIEDKEDTNITKIEAIEIKQIEFNGSQIQGIMGNDGNIYVAISPFCRELGIHSKDQRTKINAHHLLKSSRGMIPIVAEDGKLREQLCIKATSLPLWIALINPKKVKESLKDFLILFHDQIVQVLSNAFIKIDNQERIEEKKDNLNTLSSLDILNSITQSINEQENKRNELSNQISIKLLEIENKTENRTLELEKKISILELRSEKNKRLEQLIIPEPTHIFENLQEQRSKRALINTLVQNYSRERNITTQEAWNILYENAKFKISLIFSKSEIESKKSKIEIVENKGLIEHLYNLAYSLFVLKNVV